MTVDEVGFQIGVISDTHGLLRPEALSQLRGVGHIIHAGDIGAPGILDALGSIAPVAAIRGNIDTAPWAAGIPATRTLLLAGLSIHVVHDLAPWEPGGAAAGADVVISGHSHRPRIERRDGTLFLNPGSAGPRRFRLPVTLAVLTVGRAGPVPRIHDLLE